MEFILGFLNKPPKYSKFSTSQKLPAIGKLTNDIVAHFFGIQCIIFHFSYFLGRLVFVYMYGSLVHSSMYKENDWSEQKSVVYFLLVI